MAHPHHTEGFSRTEDAVTVLFCLVDDAYAAINPRAKRYESLKRLSDSEVLTLALCSTSFGAWRASARSCATPGGSSRTCSRAWQAWLLPRSTAACAS